MAQTIKISDEEMEYLRSEARLASRSLSGQAEHWLRIGRAIEKSRAFSYQHISDALEGRYSPDELTAEEQEIFFQEFAEYMGETTPEQEAFFAQRRKNGLGVGLDENDNLIYQQPE